MLKNARKIRKTYSLYPTPGRHYHLIRSSLRKGLACSSKSKESACDVGDQRSIPGLGSSSGEGNGNPLQYSCLENPHGWRSLVGYNAWGRKELDMSK